MSTRCHLQRCLSTSQLNFWLPSLRKRQGVRNVKHSCNRCHSNPFAFLPGLRNAIKGNNDDLWAASAIYLLLTKGVVPIQSKSVSSTSHGFYSACQKKSKLLTAASFVSATPARQKAFTYIFLYFGLVATSLCT